VPYGLQGVNELQEYILRNMQTAGDVHEMYERSLQVEPREREDEKIARYVFIPLYNEEHHFAGALSVCHRKTFTDDSSAGCSPNPVSYDETARIHTTE
jgi:hypothetical protein